MTRNKSQSRFGNVLLRWSASNARAKSPCWRFNVGWVEASGTHRLNPARLIGFAILVCLAITWPLRGAEPKLVGAGLLFRARDDRPLISKERAKSFGLQIHESKRLRLFTDIDPEVAESLLPLIDQVYEAWEDYFGALPPAEDDREFQINGYLIKDKAKFEKASLLRNDLPDKFHGQQIGYEFWMMDQDRDYYRRHLLLHESTHAFMRAMTPVELPLAYLEGMAEYFGTHRLVEGKLAVAVYPHNRTDFRGHDRMFLLRRDVKARTGRKEGLPTFRDLGEWKAGSFRLFNESYAWAWGACTFLDRNPRTRTPFRELARSLNDPLAWPKFLDKLEPERAEITTEWNLFAAEAFESYDFDRMSIRFRDGRPLAELRGGAEPFRCFVNANAGWQSSGLLVEKGQQYEVKATGQVTLAEKLGEVEKPWVSEAEGITFRYHVEQPLGRLMATVRPTNAEEKPVVTTEGDEVEPMFDVEWLGSKATIMAKRTGTLYLRLNDHPGELSDNRGRIVVELK